MIIGGHHVDVHIGDKVGPPPRTITNMESKKADNNLLKNHEPRSKTEKKRMEKKPDAVDEAGHNILPPSMAEKTNLRIMITITIIQAW